MPGFVKDKKDEARWGKAKSATSKSKGKKESSFSDRDWALTNYLYHKMGKTEEDNKNAELAKKELMKFGGMLQLSSPKVPSVKVPMKTGTQSTAVKMPKPKKMADPFGKPSLFFKSEDLEVKHPSICKLRDFIQKKHR